MQVETYKNLKDNVALALKSDNDLQLAIAITKLKEYSMDKVVEIKEYKTDEGSLFKIVDVNSLEIVFDYLADKKEAVNLANDLNFTIKE